MNRNTIISFYSALIFTVFIILIDICYIFMFASPNTWTTLENYITNYQFIELLPELIGFILLPSFLLTITGIIYTNNLKEDLLVKLSLSFASAFVFLVSIGYFIQFAVVFPNQYENSVKLYEIWIFGNTEKSIAWGLNYLGWFWGGVSTFILSLYLKDKLVKVLFALYGILLFVALVGYSLRIELMQTVLGLAWFIILPISFIRLTIIFKRINKGELEVI